VADEARGEERVDDGKIAGGEGLCVQPAHEAGRVALYHRAGPMIAIGRR
jgi:hypothetical protein